MNNESRVILPKRFPRQTGKDGDGYGRIRSVQAQCVVFNNGGTSPVIVAGEAKVGTTGFCLRCEQGCGAIRVRDLIDLAPEQDPILTGRVVIEPQSLWFRTHIAQPPFPEVAPQRIPS